MMSPGKLNVDPDSSSEQDSISEKSTIKGRQDIYKPKPVPPNIRRKPINYLHVDKLDVPICGQYFINASIPPVPKSVPYVATGTENLLLLTSRGPVTANVWVTGNNPLGRVSMNIFTKQGDIQAKVHDAFSASASERRPSLDIELRTDYGSVYLSLPRLFRGLITTQNSREKEVTLSPALEERTVLLSDVKGTRVYLVGDRPRAWMSWRDYNDTGRFSEEILDKIIVQHWTSDLRIRWDGELEPMFPPE